MEGSGLRWRGARSLVNGSERWWRGAIAGGGERSLAEGSAGERSLVEGRGLRWSGAIAGGGEQCHVEGSDSRLRGAISGGGERSQVEGSNYSRGWRGAVAGGGERSLVEGRGLRWRPLHLLDGLQNYMIFIFESHKAAMVCFDAKKSFFHLCCCK